MGHPVRKRSRSLKSAKLLPLSLIVRLSLTIIVVPITRDIRVYAYQSRRFVTLNFFRAIVESLLRDKTRSRTRDNSRRKRKPPSNRHLTLKLERIRLETRGPDSPANAALNKVSFSRVSGTICKIRLAKRFNFANHCHAKVHAKSGVTRNSF